MKTTNEDFLWVRTNGQQNDAGMLAAKMEQLIDELIKLDMALQALRFENPTARRVIFVDGPCEGRDDKSLGQYHPRLREEDWMRAALVWLQSIKTSCPDARFEWLDELIESCPLSPGLSQGQDGREERDDEL